MRTDIKVEYTDVKAYRMVIKPIGPFRVLTRPYEFLSSEISQTLRDFLEYLNRSNTFSTNLKASIILPPTFPRIGTEHVGHAKFEIS